ncbi:MULTISPECIES: YebC/PmpR family DNA-binding transcriptional regulator [Tepidanaerobacter]|uniref:Probable transcriptional regulatory protein TSYNT_9577 n=1 Tax=Tepidanaerobacter syntrophicus TaxID=224999 RepID=A0A0U9HHI3_9FIRM|nr:MULTISPECIES: YebC/PmpR family DNA-binding transcriptional regulator [Tepidanaerobacter]GAQ26313.1 DNA-binding regulatory protein, YebC/PmpR family [Tepidanaerobacter syntrophicus]GLI19301.1 putative transcriptional regulatory protein [Tepidanaerobacter syntrophicus]GLI50065.1 putative transcriptional regulatory protein [Tepidanaerobacter syntrophicus]HHV83083.1 YebC/PmpR family DNA-binding transcriptional regulator [Tepidanaerobacter syntrophicus]
MSGHSKWANIKNKKAKMDAQKGKIYTRFSKLIIVAVREGGPDPNSNSKLKDVIEKAKQVNMPNENIERAIKRATGELSGADYEEIMYEGYGPSGVAILVDATTDNRNRTAGEMRHIFDKHGGNLGETGCVAWMFEKKGLIIIEKDDSTDVEEIMMLAIDAGAEDVDEQEDSIEVTTSVENFAAVKDAFEKNGIKIFSADLTYIPKTTLSLSESECEKVERLIEALEDHDDVQNVYTNYEPAE